MIDSNELFEKATEEGRIRIEKAAQGLFEYAAIKAAKEAEEKHADVLKWHQRFMKILKDNVGTWSKDPSTKVAAMIVEDESHAIASTGYNGFAQGVQDLPARLNNRELKLLLTIHAEENAIYRALKRNVDLSKCTLYVYPTLMKPNTCPHCASVIAQNGIRRVVGYRTDNVLERWQKLAEASQIVYDEVGIEMIWIEE